MDDLHKYFEKDILPKFIQYLSYRVGTVNSINNVPPDAYGNVNIDYSREILYKLYPIGALYLTLNSTNPASFLNIGIWQLIDGGAGGYNLISAGGSYTSVDINNCTPNNILSTKVGTNSVTLGIDNMPEHDHNISTGDITTSSNGSHNHGRGTLNITGTFAADDSTRGAHYGAAPTGAFYDAGRVNLDLTSDGGRGTMVGFDASRCDSWKNGKTSTDGNHTHTVTISADKQGKGAPINITPLSIPVYIWVRTA